MAGHRPPPGWHWHRALTWWELSNAAEPRLWMTVAEIGGVWEVSAWQGERLHAVRLVRFERSSLDSGKRIAEVWLRSALYPQRRNYKPGYSPQDLAESDAIERHERYRPLARAASQAAARDAAHRRLEARLQSGRYRKRKRRGVTAEVARRRRRARTQARRADGRFR